MQDRLIFVAGFLYRISNTLAMNEAKDGEFVLCLNEVRDNALPENKNNQVPIYYQWATNNDCNGCRKIIETNNPKLIQKGVNNLKIT